MEFKTTFTPNEPGAYELLPDDVYRQAPGMSNSQLKIVRRSPRDFWDMQAGLLEREPTDAMEYGNILHQCILQNRTPDTLFYTQPTVYGTDARPWNNNANVCKEWHAAHSDKPVLTESKANQLKDQIEYVRQHPRFVNILGSRTEVSLFARGPYGVLAKGRLDAIRVNGDDILITDLKSTIDASTEAISREILRRKYHVQAGQYTWLVKQLAPQARILYLFIFLEKGLRPKCNFRYLSRRAIERGEEEFLDNLDRYRLCRTHNQWPEWGDEEENVGFVDLPDFMYDDELTGATEA